MHTLQICALCAPCTLRALICILVHNKILFVHWVLCTFVYLLLCMFLGLCTFAFAALQDWNYGELYKFNCTPVTLRLWSVSVPHLTWNWLSRPGGPKQRNAHIVHKVHQVHSQNRRCAPLRVSILPPPPPSPLPPSPSSPLPPPPPLPARRRRRSRASTGPDALDRIFCHSTQRRRSCIAKRRRCRGCGGVLPPGLDCGPVRGPRAASGTRAVARMSPRETDWSLHSICSLVCRRQTKVFQSLLVSMPTMEKVCIVAKTVYIRGSEPAKKSLLWCKKGLHFWSKRFTTHVKNMPKSSYKVNQCELWWTLWKSYIYLPPEAGVALLVTVTLMIWHVCVFSRNSCRLCRSNTDTSLISVWHGQWPSSSGRFLQQDSRHANDHHSNSFDCFTSTNGLIKNTLINGSRCATAGTSFSLMAHSGKFGGEIAWFDIRYDRSASTRANIQALRIHLQ